MNLVHSHSASHHQISRLTKIALLSITNAILLLIRTSVGLDYLRRLINMNKELLIKVSEQEVEYESSDETNDRRGAESPDQVWILDSIGSSKGDRGRDSSHEEGDGHDKFLHVGRGTGVSDFVGCNIDEDLRASCHSDRDSIEPEGERRDASTNVTGRSTVAASRRLVDIVWITA